MGHRTQASVDTQPNGGQPAWSVARLGDNSESEGRSVVGWLVRSASPQTLLAFRAIIFGQKGREAVGDERRTKEVPRRRSARAPRT